MTVAVVGAGPAGPAPAGVGVELLDRRGVADRFPAEG